MFPLRLACYTNILAWQVNPDVVFPSYTLQQCVIDGDLCELYNSLDPAKKRGISEDLDRTPNEVLNKWYVM